MARRRGPGVASNGWGVIKTRSRATTRATVIGTAGLVLLGGCLLSVPSSASAATPTTIACTTTAVKNALAHSGNYVFSTANAAACSSIAAPGPTTPFEVRKGVTVTLAGTATLTSAGGQIIEVDQGGSLTLTGQQDGAVTPGAIQLQGALAGIVPGTAGPRITLPYHPNGKDGAPGATGASGAWGTPGASDTGDDGGDGQDGESGGDAGAATNGGAVKGGAILNAGTLALSGVEFTGNEAYGGDGGGGGNGGNGGSGGTGADGGSGTPGATAGACSNGQNGGKGGAGGSGGRAGDGGVGSAGANGGDAEGGAIFNTGTLTISQSAFSMNVAIGGGGGAGGSGGKGGSGGAGGTGANGGTGSGLDDSGCEGTSPDLTNGVQGAPGAAGASRPGGAGESGARGGNGGAARGGAIFNTGKLTITTTTFVGDQAQGGDGGPNGSAGSGGNGGKGGSGADVPVGGSGAPTAGADGSSGGDGAPAPHLPDQAPN